MPAKFQQQNWNEIAIITDGKQWVPNAWLQLYYNDTSFDPTSLPLRHALKTHLEINFSILFSPTLSDTTKACI